VLLEEKAYDAALQALSDKFPTEMHAVVADRKGDVLALQGKNAEAAAEYSSAYAAFGENVEYRRLVEVKLNALGIKPVVQAAASVTEVKK
jgi:predicted negative regulator of RcsB-dependent stress response